MPNYWTTPYLATATALILHLPVLGNSQTSGVSRWVDDELRPLERPLAELVVEATAPSSYVSGTAFVMLSLMSQVARRLVSESKSLETGFSEIVDREFWNLLR